MFEGLRCNLDGLHADVYWCDNLKPWKLADEEAAKAVIVARETAGQAFDIVIAAMDKLKPDWRREPDDLPS